MSMKLGTERTIHFHTTSSPDLGLTLTHTPTTLAMGISTGYVRITSINADGGMVTGDVRVNDVVVEAAGVNMRRPISEGMWKLTLGLMEVAPLPLEIVVAQEVEEEEEEEDKLTNQDTGMEEEKEQGYYQLTTPSKYNVVNDPVLSAKLYPLDTNISPDACPISPLPESPEETRNPFLDSNRFGPERTIVFRTESLGVKLHRSAKEGIVHILHVTSYQAPDSAQAPREGEINVGDAIMEVGGVNLRNQFIGRIEWADMVHFIRYVGRPLEMVVAKDDMFCVEDAGLNALEEEKDAYEVVRESVVLDEKKCGSEHNTEQPSQEQQPSAEEKRDETSIAAIEANATTALRNLDEDFNEVMLDNICGAMPKVDNVCNAMTAGLCTSPGVDQTDEDVNELCSTPDEIVEATVVSPVLKVSPGNVKKDNSWIKNSDETKNDVSSPSRSPLTVFPRTHPLAEKDDMHTAVEAVSGDECIVAQEPVEEDVEVSKFPADPESPVGEGTVNDDNDDCLASPEVVNSPLGEAVSPERKSVAELKGLFSPIKVPQPPKSPKPVANEEKQEVYVASSDEKKSVEEVFDNPCNEMADIESDVEQTVSSATGQSVVEIPNNDRDVVDESVPETDNTVDFDAECLEVIPNEQEITENDGSAQLAELAVNLKLHDDDEQTSAQSNEVQMQAVDPTSANVINDSYAIELEPTPEKPFDETANSSLHEELVNEPASEFTSPSEKMVQQSDSRDDIEHQKHRDKPKKTELKAEESKNVVVCPKPEKKPPLPPATSLSTPAPATNTFNSVFVIDDTDSPFCGNIKFSSSPKDRVPASALFSQAFVVQRNGEDGISGPPVTDNIRWDATNSPLFVIKKGSSNIRKNQLEWSPYPQGERTPPERLFPDPLVAFDMSELDTSMNASDDGSLSDDPSYNPNDTIVYADEADAQANCCGFDNFCADNVMFQGLVSNCSTDPDAQRLAKEKANKVPSPRRKNLLSRLRKGGKKNKEKVSYGNLDDEMKESMKDIKKAHVQLRKQNLYGKSVEAASQYASMSDMIEI
ncbi:hypothetical protein ACHAWO_007414 [Cyclotella atomus]|uniref:PDZ domain-containing protein n=1 Tax=Cyclotella atomus TaxID=382360 RepID=A0ABD3QF97_9STRA